MIRMIKGTYGRVVEGGVEAMTKRSAPFSLTAEREAELIAAGVAEKVEEIEQAKVYENMKMADLRKVAAERGVDVSSAKKKSEVVAILEAAEAAPQLYHDEKEYSGLLSED